MWDTCGHLFLSFRRVDAAIFQAAISCRTRLHWADNSESCRVRLWLWKELLVWCCISSGHHTCTKHLLHGLSHVWMVIEVRGNHIAFRLGTAIFTTSAWACDSTTVSNCFRLDTSRFLFFKWQIAIVWLSVRSRFRAHISSVATDVWILLVWWPKKLSLGGKLLSKFSVLRCEIRCDGKEVTAWLWLSNWWAWCKHSHPSLRARIFALSIALTWLVDLGWCSSCFLFLFLPTKNVFLTLFKHLEDSECELRSSLTRHVDAVLDHNLFWETSQRGDLSSG